MGVYAPPCEVTNTVGINKLPQQSQWSRERNRFEWDWVRQNPGKATLLPLQWHHNGRDCVSNHQPCDCLHNRLFRLRSKKTSKLRATGPRKWPVTRKMFPCLTSSWHCCDMVFFWQKCTPLQSWSYSSPLLVIFHTLGKRRCCVTYLLKYLDLRYVQPFQQRILKEYQSIQRAPNQFVHSHLGIIKLPFICINRF